MSQPLGEIEIGVTREQAEAIVTEYDHLYRHSTRDGKKKMHSLPRLRDTLAAVLHDLEPT